MFKLACICMKDTGANLRYPLKGLLRDYSREQTLGIWAGFLAKTSRVVLAPSVAVIDRNNRLRFSGKDLQK